MVYRDTDTDGLNIVKLYITQDGNFDVTATIDGSTGTVVNRFLYTPYGARTVLTATWTAGSTDFMLGHQGLMLDGESNLYYNRARYLHTSLGTFIARDPLGYVDGMNVYQYERSSPNSNTDETGLRVPSPEAGDRVWDFSDARSSSIFLSLYAFYHRPIYYTRSTRYGTSAEWAVLGGDFLWAVRGQKTVLMAQESAQTDARLAARAQLQNGGCKRQSFKASGDRQVLFDWGSTNVLLSLARFHIYWEIEGEVIPTKGQGECCTATFSGRIHYTIYDLYDFPAYLPTGWLGAPFHVTGTWDELAGGEVSMAKDGK